MRKHRFYFTRPCLASAAVLVLLVAACSRDKRDPHPDGAAPDGPIASAARGGVSVASGLASSMDAVSAASALSLKVAAEQAVMTTGSGAPLPPASDPAGTMLVRHGEASVEVRHVDDAVARMRQAAAQFGGFVANTAVRSGKDEPQSASLEVRVPTAQFDGLLAALHTVGKVERITAGAEDVVEEYVDLGARAANARRVEARLIEMLATRTGKLSDVLTVEQELARVRQEIERHDARLRWLERRAALSSLTVALHEPVGLIDRPSPGPIVEAIGLAWQRTLGIIAWCIASLGILVPLGVLVGAGVLVLRRARAAERVSTTIDPA
ncbi:hypothetical protein BH11GEM1_BH11GEM1_02010 [soil metagenome]